MIPYVTIIVLNSMILGKIWKSTQFRKRFVVSERSALGTLGGTEPRWKLVSRVARALQTEQTGREINEREAGRGRREEGFAMSARYIVG